MDVEFHDLLFGVRRSIRYHARRIVFFDALYKWTQAGAVVTGSAMDHKIEAPKPC